jgi:hypothetical protein
VPGYLADVILGVCEGVWKRLTFKSVVCAEQLALPEVGGPQPSAEGLKRTKLWPSLVREGIREYCSRCLWTWTATPVLSCLLPAGPSHRFWICQPPWPREQPISYNKAHLARYPSIGLHTSNSSRTPNTTLKMIIFIFSFFFFFSRWLLNHQMSLV